MTILSKLLNTYLEDYLSRVEQSCKITYDRVVNDFELGGWDLDIVAPYPKSWARDYKITLNKRNFYSRFITHNLSSRRMDQPDMVTLRVDAWEKYLLDIQSQAKSSFDAYIYKLENKIGSGITDASIVGSMWTGSTLTIIKDKEVEYWTTKIIINQSKFSKLFNQFPSRKIKQK